MGRLTQVINNFSKKKLVDDLAVPDNAAVQPAPENKAGFRENAIGSGIGVRFSTLNQYSINPKFSPLIKRRSLFRW